jgi:hypothetical protein
MLFVVVYNTKAIVVHEEAEYSQHQLAWGNQQPYANFLYNAK